MRVRLLLSGSVSAALIAVLTTVAPSTAIAAPAYTVTISAQPSAFYGDDPTPNSIGYRYPTVGISAHIDNCPPGISRYNVTMTQDGVAIPRVYSGSLSEGDIETCDPVKGFDFGAEFGGPVSLAGAPSGLRPGEVVVAASIRDVQDATLATTTRTVKIPPLPLDGKITIAPITTRVETAKRPGQTLTTKRITIGALISECRPGVTYALSTNIADFALRGAYYPQFAPEIPMVCPRSGYKAILVNVYGQGLESGKTRYTFLLRGANGLNWDTRIVTTPRHH